MKALIQRVRSARVEVEGEVVGAIGSGLLVFLAVEKGDPDAVIARMAHKIAGLRIFADEAGRMNRSVREVGGAVLVVSQFTLAGTLQKGFRPSFSRAELPERAATVCHAVAQHLRQAFLPVAEGRFGADMQVHLQNDGPVTFWLDFPPTGPGTTDQGEGSSS